jgi:hypothetical protein
MGGTMSRRTLYLLSGIAVLGFVVGLLFIPDTFWGLYGATVDSHGIWIGRYMTSIMLANVYLFWSLRDSPATSMEAKHFSRGQVVAWGLVGLFIAIYTIRGGYGAFAWGTVALSAIFAVLFALDGFRS